MECSDISTGNALHLGNLRQSPKLWGYTSRNCCTMLGCCRLSRSRGPSTASFLSTNSYLFGLLHPSPSQPPLSRDIPRSNMAMEHPRTEDLFHSSPLHHFTHMLAHGHLCRLGMPWRLMKRDNRWGP